MFIIFYPRESRIGGDQPPIFGEKIFSRFATPQGSINYQKITLFEYF